MKDGGIQRVREREEEGREGWSVGGRGRERRREGRNE